MGRTLHYTLKPVNGRFTKKELDKLYNVGKVWFEKCDWTCESFCIEPYCIYPNWKNESNWDKVNNRYKELQEQDLHPNKICRQLVKEKIALLHRSNAKYSFSGFTKVGGNELNALQVVYGLVAASKVVSNVKIYLDDEGEFLQCPVVIQKGLAMPNSEVIYEKIGSLLGRCSFDPGYKKYKKKFTKLSERLFSILKKYEDGIINRIPTYNVSEFCRPIKAEDFEEYPEYSASQILAGFDGEYYNLNDKDPEAESYRCIAEIQKLLPDNIDLQVAPKLEK